MSSLEWLKSISEKSDGVLNKILAPIFSSDSMVDKWLHGFIYILIMVYFIKIAVSLPANLPFINNVVLQVLVLFLVVYMSVHAHPTLILVNVVLFMVFLYFMNKPTIATFDGAISDGSFPIDYAKNIPPITGDAAQYAGGCFPDRQANMSLVSPFDKRTFKVEVNGLTPEYQMMANEAKMAKDKGKPQMGDSTGWSKNDNTVHFPESGTSSIGMCGSPVPLLQPSLSTM